MGPQEVRFSSGGCTIAGTFTEVTAPVAAALLITGSGKLNRDSDARLIRTGVTREVADALAGARVATLRYDKRGAGASGGDYLRAGMAGNLADARAGLGWLAARAAGLPLLTVGHSEGTYYAAELAATDAGVAGAVLLGAPARSGEQVISWQIEMMARQAAAGGQGDHAAHPHRLRPVTAQTAGAAQGVLGRRHPRAGRAGQRPLVA